MGEPAKQTAMGRNVAGQPGGPAASATHSRPPEPLIGKDGKPIYDQDFFLALADCGKDVWNQWRAEHSDGNIDEHTYVRVIFAGIDFNILAKGSMDFSGFEFGHGADFSNASFGFGTNLSAAIFGDDTNFASASFGYRADLSEANFGNRADLSGASFGDNANLRGVNFARSAHLDGATFGRSPNLLGASFGTFANLSNASFGDDANLSDASFEDFANFSGASFGLRANLMGSSFGDNVDFSGASFGHRANLSGARFGTGAYFCGLSEPDWRERRTRSFTEPPFQNWTEERKEEFSQWPEAAASRPNCFSWISFSYACFRGPVDFTGRAIAEGVDFTSVQFDGPPRFDSLDWIDLYGVEIGFTSARLKGLQLRGWTTRSDIALQIRRMRADMEGLKNHDLERDLYIEERKAERGIYLAKHIERARHDIRRKWRNVVRQRGKPGGLGRILPFMISALLTFVRTGLCLGAHVCWICVIAGYGLLADYGRSFLRPLAALVLSVVLFQAAYWYTLGPSLPAAFWPRFAAAIVHVWQPVDTSFARAARAVSLANAVPFVGALSLDKETKETLIYGHSCYGDVTADAPKVGAAPCPPVPPLRYQALALTQTVFSLLCTFFIALALRNYFRVK